jgi:mycothiol synthase
MSLDEHKLPGLYMLWPRHRLAEPRGVEVPLGYTLRTYAVGDEAAYRQLLAVEHWSLTEVQWEDYMDRLLPNGLFLLFHGASQTLVTTAGAVHNPRAGRYYFPFGGELAYLVVHPAYRGRGLGQFASACVVRRLLAAGYECIRVGVQGFRLTAIKTYLKLGFVPFLHQEDLFGRWERICDRLGWPYTPEEWPETLSAPPSGELVA